MMAFYRAAGVNEVGRRIGLRVFIWASVANLAMVVLFALMGWYWPTTSKHLLWVIATPPMALESAGFGFRWNLWFWLTVNPFIYGAMWWFAWRMWRLMRAKTEE